MKKIVLILLALSLWASPLCARELAVVNGDDLTVKVSLLTNPPVVGTNNLRVDLFDSNGKPVTDAKVRVNYSMKPMKGMTPMHYKTNAKLKADSYIVALETRMKGEWDVKLRIKRKNAASRRLKTKIEVR